MKEEKGGGFQKSNQGFVALWLMGKLVCGGKGRLDVHYALA
jgi:hypothetical protein